MHTHVAIKAQADVQHYDIPLQDTTYYILIKHLAVDGSHLGCGNSVTQFRQSDNPISARRQPRFESGAGDILPFPYAVTYTKIARI